MIAMIQSNLAMSGGLIAVLVIGGVLILIILFAIGMYNKLVVGRNRVKTRTPRSMCSSTVGTTSSRTWSKRPRAI